MKISDIIHYPVKSLAGNKLTRAEVHERGLKDDRRLMLIDENNIFVSQRKFPQLCMIEVGITEDYIVLVDRRSNEAIRHKLEFELHKTEVSIWNKLVTSHLFLYKELDEWISERTGLSLRFAYMDESDHRQIDIDYANEGEIVSFADGFPILVANSASLAALNKSLSQPIDISHFRPNLVIDHDIPWEEDKWNRLQIGEVVLRLPKPCARCTVINIDPESGKTNPEVLLTLSKERLVDGKILFGMNAIVEKTGRIKRGDQVSILD
jgi:uncharacterized protein YcbX